jgi:hypothetical protein
MSSAIVPSTNSKVYSGFDARQIPDCALWLDAADSSTLTLSGSSVTAWADKSGNGRNASAITSPTFSNSAVNFSGSQGFSTTLSASTNIESGFFICSFTSVSKVNTLLGGSGNGSRQFRTDSAGVINTISQNVAGVLFTGAALSTNTRYIVQYVNTGTTLTHYLNGATYASASAASYSGGSTTNIGCRLNNASDAESLSGTIHEILIFNSGLTTLQRQQVEGYLAWKWGLQGNLPASHPYKSFPVFARIFNPLDVPSCVLWLDAADSTTLTLSGTSVTTWADKSGNGRNATQTTAGNRPVYSSANRNVRFTRSSSHFLNLPDSTLPTGNSAYGYFIVCSWAQAIDGLGLIGGGNYGSGGQVFAMRSTGTNRRILTYWWGNDFETPDFAYTVNVPLLVEGVYTPGGARAIFTNGTQLATNNPSARNQGVGNNRIGLTFGSEYMDGTISEILIYNVALTSAQRQQIESYLTWKWGLQGNLPSTHPFKLYNTLTPGFLPIQTSGLALWLDAADSSTLTLSGTSVTTWADKSGNGRTGTVTGTIPYTGNINGRASLSFNGTSNTFIRGNLPNTGNTLTVFAVFTMNAVGSSATSRVVSLGVTTARDFNNTLYTGAIEGIPSLSKFDAIRNSTSLSGVTRTFGLPMIACSLFDGTNHTMFVNGTGASPVASSGNFGIATYSIAGEVGDGGSFITGAIGEIVIYNINLTTSQRQQIEGYLAWKWGLQGNLPTTHPYYKFSP